MKNKNLKIILNLILFIFSTCFTVFASQKGYHFPTGFKTDEYGYNSFFYEEDKFYNNGWKLLDINRDGMYEYLYFTISGHYLMSNTAPNGCLLNENGLLLNVDNSIYQISFTDVNNALFLNKIETPDEIKLGLKADYTYVFNNWYINATSDIDNKITVASTNMSINKANAIREEISKHTKELKQMSMWYNERLNESKKMGTIDKKLCRELINMVTADMSAFNNRFREETNNKIKALGY